MCFSVCVFAFDLILCCLLISYLLQQSSRSRVTRLVLVRNSWFVALALVWMLFFTVCAFLESVSLVSLFAVLLVSACLSFNCILLNQQVIRLWCRLEGTLQLVSFAVRMYMCGSSYNFFTNHLEYQLCAFCHHHLLFPSLLFDLTRHSCFCLDSSIYWCLWSPVQIVCVLHSTDRPFCWCTRSIVAGQVWRHTPRSTRKGWLTVRRIDWIRIRMGNDDLNWLCVWSAFYLNCSWILSPSPTFSLVSMFY